MKSSDAVLTWVRGRAWAVSAESRWTYQPIAQRRTLLTELVGRVLTQSLDKVRKALQLHRMNVMESLLAQLSKDKTDQSTRGKIRLNNIYGGLCNAVPEAGPRGAAVCLAITVTIGAHTDKIIYSYMGRQGRRVRATMSSLLDPRVSPVLDAQQSVDELLADFSSDNDKWVSMRGGN